jgi:hypothetical protein
MLYSRQIPQHNENFERKKNFAEKISRRGWRGGGRDAQQEGMMNVGKDLKSHIMQKINFSLNGKRI